MNNAQLLRDREPIRLLETTKSLSEYLLIFSDVVVVTRTEKRVLSASNGQEKTKLMLNSCLPESLYILLSSSSASFSLSSQTRYLKLTIYNNQCVLIMNLFVLLCAVHCSNYYTLNEWSRGKHTRSISMLTTELGYSLC